MMRCPWYVAVIVVAAAAAGCAREAAEQVETETVVPVTTVAATTGTVRATLQVSGLVEASPGAEQLVTAPEAARVLAITRAEGDRVRRGDVLVRFDVPSLRANAAAGEAEVARSRARLRNAEAAAARAKDLFDRGVAARKEVEDAERELADAHAAETQAASANGASTALADRAIVRAAFDGIVVMRAHNPGDLVDAAAGPVLRVIDPRRLEVEASVPLADIGRLRLGAPAHLVGADAEATRLEVVSRPAAVATGTATVPVRLRFLGPTTLPAGMPVQVAIDAETHTGVAVPVRAVVHDGADTAVFVVAGDVAHRRAVEPGIAGGDLVEILSGVKAGEAVVVDGQAGLPDGARVSPRAATP